jgi:hypothetical protein
VILDWTGQVGKTRDHYRGVDLLPEMLDLIRPAQLFQASKAGHQALDPSPANKGNDNFLVAITGVATHHNAITKLGMLNTISGRKTPRSPCGGSRRGCLAPGLTPRWGSTPSSFDQVPRNIA